MQDLIDSLKIISIGILAFILMLVIITLIHEIGSNLLTLFLEYFLPISVIVYLVYLYKQKSW